MNLSTRIKQNPVASFIILTLGLSVATCLLPVPKESGFVVMAFILVLIPTIVAFALVAVTEGRRGVRAFLGEVFRWHMALKWVIIALAISLTIRLGNCLIAVVTGTISTIEFAAPTAFFIVYFPLALLEEIGWRGFVLQRLLPRHSLFAASLILGIPWGLIHFVLFLVTRPEVSAVAEMLAAVALSLPLAWIYVRSGRLILITTLLHGALNAFGILELNIPTAAGLWFLVVSNCIVAAILVLIDRHIWLARPTKGAIGHAIAPAVQPRAVQG